MSDFEAGWGDWVGQGLEGWGTVAAATHGEAGGRLAGDRDFQRKGWFTGGGEYHGRWDVEVLSAPSIGMLGSRWGGRPCRESVLRVRLLGRVGFSCRRKKPMRNRERLIRTVLVMAAMVGMCIHFGGGHEAGALTIFDDGQTHVISGPLNDDVEVRSSFLGTSTALLLVGDGVINGRVSLLGNSTFQTLNLTPKVLLTDGEHHLRNLDIFGTSSATLNGAQVSGTTTVTEGASLEAMNSGFGTDFQHGGIVSGGLVVRGNAQALISGGKAIDASASGQSMLTLRDNAGVVDTLSGSDSAQLHVESGSLGAEFNLSSSGLRLSDMAILHIDGSQTAVTWGEFPPTLNDDSVMNVINPGDWTIVIGFGAHTPTMRVHGANLKLNGVPFTEPVLVTFDTASDGAAPFLDITGPSVADGTGALRIQPDFPSDEGMFFDSSVLLVPVPEPGIGVVLGGMILLASARRERF